MKQLLIPILKRCSCAGMFLCSLHIPSGFGGRAECELIMAHTSQGVLAAWGEDRAGNEGVRNRAVCELELL